MSATGHQLRRRLAEQKAAQQAQEASPAPTQAPEPQASHTPAVFDLSGNWMRKRAEVRDVLGMERVPKNKDEARAALETAGYEVTGDGA